MLTDPLLIIGVFMLGASAGSLLTHLRLRGIMSREREIPQHNAGQYLHTQGIFGFKASAWVKRKSGQATDTYSGDLPETPTAPDVSRANLASAKPDLAASKLDRVPHETNTWRVSA